ncbi:hypothetical protein LY28_01138 [Ruminiclostridium sufflavum DSM 19573]|uniref:DUF2004 domain-containing protein n=1 Tax=Ruminiclostridium sufflavum DSM 19573 TaxID=1121337 RepID=A0A318XM30_9FIRM|nr:hypothetical protein [Ruminiclostridium sufflavum]PYG88782.1 hypothetical protein LY28_01138 [Ruminiclostridium sufflavum DSM 19573]
MKREDFILSDPYYETEAEGILIKIHRDFLNQSSIAYANKIFELYLYKKSEVIDYVLNHSVLDFYKSRYARNEIAEKLNEADIEIMNDRWGCLTWRNHNLDEHIIQVEFNDEMQLSYVSIDG